MKIYADPKDNPNQNTVKSENPNAFSDKLTAPTEKEKLKDLKGKDKYQYIWDYYKFPIIAVIVGLFVITSTIYSRMHAKDVLLSISCANVNIEDDLSGTLTQSFVEEYLGMNPSKYEVILDAALMVGDNENAVDAQYAYTSQMKLVAFVSAGQMDIVLMNQTGFDFLSQSEFLQDLSEVFTEFDPSLNDSLKDALVNNYHIVQDNASEVAADPSIEYTAELEEHPYGLRLTGSKYFPEGYFNQDIYVGIAVNSSKTEANVQYLRYLFGLEPGEFNLIPEK